MGLKHNFSDLQSQLDELERKVARNMSKEALEEAAEVVLDSQKITVPKDTRQLDRSLIVGKVSGTGGKRKIVIGIDPAKREKVRYGYYQEYGTRVMLGKKWMKKAWTKSSEEALNKLGDVLARKLRGR